MLRDLNASVFNDIQQWVLNCFNATKLQGEPTITEATGSFPVLNNTTPGHLLTALVSTSKCLHISNTSPELETRYIKTEYHQFYEHVDYLSCFWSPYSSMRSESNVLFPKKNLEIEL